MAELGFSLLVALAGLVGFALAVVWVRRSPTVGAALIGLMLVSNWEVPNPPALITLAGTSVYPNDAIPLLLFAVGLLEVKQLRANLQGWIFTWVFFGLLIAAALLRGVPDFGPVAAAHEGRPLLHFFWAMTWVLGLRPDRLRLHTFSLVLGWVLVFVAVYHGVRYGIGGASSTIPLGGGAVKTGRVLTAPQAMALLLCAATVFVGQSSAENVRPRFYAVSALAFTAVVIVAQHRSVWGAGVLGMVAVLIWSGRTRARRQVFVQSVLGAWVVLVAWYSGLLSGSGIADSASNTSTYEWRTEGWQVLISQAIARGPMVVLTGDPFGSGASFRRVPTSGGWTQVQAHNWYVSIFLYLGIIGLLTYATMLFAALVKSRAVPPAWTFVIAAIAGYGWAYSVDWFLVVWLGAAVTVSLGSGRIPESPVPESGLTANSSGMRTRPALASR